MSEDQQEFWVMIALIAAAFGIMIAIIVATVVMS